MIDQDLINRALQIKNETQRGANTASRVGGLIEDIVKEKSSLQPKKIQSSDLFIELPISDGNQSCTHPSVVRYPGGWNGYEYWMAATPYPDLARENPSIFCSHDGSTWEVPKGMVNPLFQPGVYGGLLYGGFSDPQMLILEKPIGSLQSGTMFLLGRAIYDAGNEALIYRTSLDGSNWSSPVVMIQNSTGYKYVSPAIVQEEDGSLTMWAVDISVTPHVLKKYTSTDLLNWTNYTNAIPCTFRNSLRANGLWHLDVKKRGVYYHALINNNNSRYTLNYCVSLDGINWEGKDGPVSVIIEQTRQFPDGINTYDKRGFYKSCFTPSPGSSDKWDMWIVRVSTQRWDNPNLLGTDTFNSIHRIQFIKDIKINKPTLNLSMITGANINISAFVYTKLVFTNMIRTDWWDDTNNRFQPPIGWYCLQASAHWAADQGTGSRYITFYKNGLSLGLIGSENVGVGGQSHSAATNIQFMNGSDYIEVYVYQATSGVASVMRTNGTYFNAFQLDSL